MLHSSPAGPFPDACFPAASLTAFLHCCFYYCFLLLILKFAGAFYYCSFLPLLMFTATFFIAASSYCCFLLVLLSITAALLLLSFNCFFHLLELSLLMRKFFAGKLQNCHCSGGNGSLLHACFNYFFDYCFGWLLTVVSLTAAFLYCYFLLLLLFCSFSLLQCASRWFCWLLTVVFFDCCFSVPTLSFTAAFVLLDSLLLILSSVIDCLSYLINCLIFCKFTPRLLLASAIDSFIHWLLLLLVINCKSLFILDRFCWCCCLCCYFTDVLAYQIGCSYCC